MSINAGNSFLAMGNGGGVSESRKKPKVVHSPTAHRVIIPVTDAQKAYKGIVINYNHKKNYLLMWFMGIASLAHMIFSAITLAEGMTSFLTGTESFTFAYLIVTALILTIALLLSGWYFVNLSLESRNERGTPTWRHYIDTSYPCFVLLVHFLFSISALFVWRSQFGDTNPNPRGFMLGTHDYSLYMRWNFVMLYVTLGGLFVSFACGKGVHALRNVEMMATEEDFDNTI
jgi:hypothetical protein